MLDQSFIIFTNQKATNWNNKRKHVNGDELGIRDALKTTTANLLTVAGLFVEPSKAVSKKRFLLMNLVPLVNPPGNNIY